MRHGPVAGSDSYLEQALELPIEQRDAWLRELESKEPQIAANIRRLLAAQASERFASFLSEPVAPPLTSNVHALEGELIGSYRIVRELGQGGMAVVYLAERADGQYSQSVALKILRFGPEGSRAQFHFAQERQILASLDHQSIARLIDAGVTATGLPYLAMEYVEGVPLDRYCEEQRLSIDARLRLFLKVADAVQYAHRHLIVHRDLKPSNIVVTPEGNIKLLDFGIAKLLEPAAFEHAAPPTRDGAQLMTPEYASPEQVLGKPITTATDIYQLGLLLYGLLSGRHPYIVRGLRPIDAFRMICESEPAPPNTTRGDLDAILLKALRKEPEHRYASVGRLIDDIRRFQRGHPVTAYEGVWGYRAGKFFRRHVAALVIAGIAILAIVSVTTWYTVQLADERNYARREAASAAQIAEFLSSVFRGSDSRVADGNITARELLDRGTARIEKELIRQPEVKARLLNVMGEAYVDYDLAEKAQPVLERALALNTQLFGSNSREAADSQQSLARLARDRGELQKAKQIFEDVLRVRERTLGPRHVATADTLTELAATFFRLADAQPAIRAAERAIDIYSHSVGPDDERTLRASSVLASSILSSGDFRRARAHYEQLLPRIERTLGPDHRYAAATLGNIAVIKTHLEDYAGAEQQLRRSLEIYERMYGPNHRTVVIRENNLGLLFSETGRLGESMAMFERALATRRGTSGASNKAEDGVSEWGIGIVLRSRGDIEHALEHFRASQEIFRQSAGTNASYADSLHQQSDIFIEQGNYTAAASVLNEALAIYRRDRPPGHYEIAKARASEALLLARTGKPEAAEAEIREVISDYQREYPSGHRVLAAARGTLGECLLAQGKIAEAEELLVSSATQLAGRLHYDRRLALQRLIRLYELKGMPSLVNQYQSELAAFEQQVRSQ
jgi:eukaryotic-like serine/threonine-protein kinase